MNHMQQQSPYEFLKYIPTPGEKHLGVAVVRFERRFIFRFKILPTEAGGLWATSGSLKTGSFNGKDKYENCFELDSSYDSDSLKAYVVENVQVYLNRAAAPQSQSAFTPSPQYQPQYQAPAPVMEQGSIFDAPPPQGDLPF